MHHIQYTEKEIILFTDIRGLSLSEVLSITGEKLQNIYSYKAGEIFVFEQTTQKYIYSTYTIKLIDTIKIRR
jgi:hypothetical protein